MTPRAFRGSILALPIVLAGLFALCRAQDIAKDSAAHKVVRVVDGDTIVISKDSQEVTIRLMGVDAPKTVRPGKPVDTYGPEASRFLRNLLSGESVKLEYHQEKPDKYGRILAYVYRAPDGLFVNAEIVRQGYGRVQEKAFKYHTSFRAHEEAAKAAKRGLWGEKPFVPPPVPEKFSGVFVFVSPGGAKYHAIEDCRHLKKSKEVFRVALEDACKRYGPCATCKPPIPPGSK